MIHSTTRGRCLFILVSLSLLIYSCKTTAPIVNSQNIDYLTTGAVADITLPINSKVAVSIDNINKKLVTVDNKTTSTDLFTTTPQIMSSFSADKLTQPAAAGAANYYTDDEITTMKASLGATGIETDVKNYLESTKRLSVELKNIDNTISTIRLYYNTYWLNATILNQQILDLQNTCNQPYATIESSLITTTRSYLTANDYTGVVSPSANILLQDYALMRNELRKYLMTIKSKLDQSFNTLTQFNIPSHLDQVKKTLDDNTKLAKGINEYDVSRASDQLKQNIQNAREAIKKDKNKETFDNIVYYTQDIKDKSIESKAATIPDGTKELVNNYMLINHENWIYRLPSVTIDKDQTDITIDIKAKDNLICAPVARNYSFTIHSTHGVKIDFSSGLFSNFGGNDFMDQSYRYEPLASDPTKVTITKNETKNKLYPSFGAFGHVYVRGATDVKLAGSFGLSTKDLNRLNIHFGPSLLIGSKNRIIITVGPVFSKTTLISDTYKEGQVIDKATAPTDVPTASFNRWGWFFSFTYNLSK